jgi:hypothetical protein
MLARYVQVTNDRSILSRGLPLAEVILSRYLRNTAPIILTERIEVVGAGEIIGCQEPLH